MNPDPEAIRAMISRRLPLEALYLCGPFDATGEPRSPDIHILAISRQDQVKDLHFIPGIAGVPRRVEVSVFPYHALRMAVETGVSSWLMFYTLDKIRRGRPIMETPDIAALHQKIVADFTPRPSFYSAVMRSLTSATRNLGEAPKPGPSRVINVNVMVLLSLSLYSIVKAKQTFTKQSELLSEIMPLLPVGAETLGSYSTAADVSRALASSKRFIDSIFGKLGIEPRCFVEQAS